MIVLLFLCSVILCSELYFTAVGVLKHFIYKVNDDNDDDEDEDHHMQHCLYTSSPFKLTLVPDTHILAHYPARRSRLSNHMYSNTLTSGDAYGAAARFASLDVSILSLH